MRLRDAGSVWAMREVLDEIDDEAIRTRLLRAVERHAPAWTEWIVHRGDCDLGAREVPRWLPLVRGLDYGQAGVDPATLRWLVGLRGLEQLRSLNLYDNGVLDAGAAVLANSGAFPRLRDLDLGCCHLTDDGASSLAQAPGFTSLRVLGLHWNSFTERGYRALGRSRALRNVHGLRIRCESIGEAGMRALFPRGAWPRLVTLDLADRRDGPRSIPALLVAPVLRRLQALQLELSNLDGGCMARLAAALPGLTELVSLGLGGNPLGDSGAAALAAAAVPSTLRTLSLHDTGITAAGAERLLAAPWRAQVSIDVDTEGLPWDLVLALRRE